MNRLSILILAALFFIPLAAFGVPSVPEGDPFASLMQFINEVGGMDSIAIASSLVVIAVQLVKKFIPTFKYYDMVVVVGGCVYAVLQLVIGGASFLSALISVLFVGGGAMAIYQLFKTPVNAIFKVGK